MLNELFRSAESARISGVPGGTAACGAKAPAAAGGAPLGARDASARPGAAIWAEDSLRSARVDTTDSVSEAVVNERVRRCPCPGVDGPSPCVAARSCNQSQHGVRACVRERESVCVSLRSSRDIYSAQHATVSRDHVKGSKGRTSRLCWLKMREKISMMRQTARQTSTRQSSNSDCGGECVTVRERERESEGER
jgi:hypothetical protein